MLQVVPLLINRAYYSRYDLLDDSENKQVGLFSVLRIALFQMCLEVVQMREVVLDFSSEETEVTLSVAPYIVVYPAA